MVELAVPGAVEPLSTPTSGRRGGPRSGPGRAWPATPTTAAKHYVDHPDHDPDDFGTRLVRYDDEGSARSPTPSGEGAIEGVVELDALQRQSSRFTRGR